MGNLNIIETIFDFFDDYFNNTVKKCPKCKQKNVLSYPVTFCQKCSTQYRDVPIPSLTLYRIQNKPSTGAATTYRVLTNIVNR